MLSFFFLFSKSRSKRSQRNFTCAWIILWGFIYTSFFKKSEPIHKEARNIKTFNFISKMLPFGNAWIWKKFTLKVFIANCYETSTQWTRRISINLLRPHVAFLCNDDLLNIRSINPSFDDVIMWSMKMLLKPKVFFYASMLWL